jgi:hypothetical protein
VIGRHRRRVRAGWLTVDRVLLVAQIVAACLATFAIWSATL